jgi:hypothetical protein
MDGVIGDGGGTDFSFGSIERGIRTTPDLKKVPIA